MQSTKKVNEQVTESIEKLNTVNAEKWKKLAFKFFSVKPREKDFQTN